MTFDIFALIIALLLVGFGYKSGAIAQTYRLAAVFAAFFAAPTVATVFKEIYYGTAELHQPLLEWAIVAGSALAVYLLVIVLGTLGVKLMRWTNEDLSRKDRIVGGLLGAIKGVAIIYLVASSLLLIEGPLEKADPDDGLHVQDSALLELVRDNQVMIPWALPDLDKLYSILDASRTRDVAELREDPSTSRVLMRDEVKELMDDREVLAALEGGNLSSLLAREDVRTLLTDREFVEELRRAKF